MDDTEFENMKKICEHGMPDIFKGEDMLGNDEYILLCMRRKTQSVMAGLIMALQKFFIFDNRKEINVRTIHLFSKSSSTQINHYLKIFTKRGILKVRIISGSPVYEPYIKKKENGHDVLTDATGELEIEGEILNMAFEIFNRTRDYIQKNRNNMAEAKENGIK